MDSGILSKRIDVTVRGALNLNKHWDPARVHLHVKSEQSLICGLVFDLLRSFWGLWNTLGREKSHRQM